MFQARNKPYYFVFILFATMVNASLANIAIAQVFLANVPKSSWDEARSTPTTTRDTSKPARLRALPSVDDRDIGADRNIGADYDGGQVPPDLQSIYDRSSSAKTLADYDSIVEFCAKLLQDKNRPTIERRYAQTLMSWAANKRGELRTDMAGEKVRLKKLTAAAELDQLAKQDFQLAIKCDKTRWRAHHNLGISYALAEEFEKAIACFDATLKLNSKCVDALSNRGELLVRAGKFTDAISDFTRAIELQPDDSRLLSARGYAYQVDGNALAAYDDFNAAKNMSPESADALLDFADACQSLSKWKEAAEAYQNVMQLEEDNGRALQNAAWMMATCPDEFYRDGKSAVSTAERAVRVFQSEPSAELLEVLAAAHAANGDYKSAVKTVSRAIEWTDSKELKKELTAHKALYQKKRPFVQPGR